MAMTLTRVSAGSRSSLRAFLKATAVGEDEESSEAKGEELESGDAASA